MKTYYINPSATVPTVAAAPAPRKLHRNSPAVHAAVTLTYAIAPAPAAPPPACGV